MAFKVVVCQLAGHQSVCGGSEGLPLHHLVVYFSYLSSFIKLFIQPVSFAFVAPLSLSCWGWRRGKGSEQLHRHLVADLGQPTAPFKPFTRFLASV